MQLLLWRWCLHVARFHSWPNLVVQVFGILQRRQCRGTFVILVLWSLCDQVYKLLFDAKPNRFCSVKYWLQLFLWLFLLSKWLTLLTHLFECIMCCSCFVGSLRIKWWLPWIWKAVEIRLPLVQQHSCTLRFTCLQTVTIIQSGVKEL